MNNKTPGFDEESALQALEQLRDQIQRARSRREQKLEEFETFLRSNRAASQAQRSTALDELERRAGSVADAARSADRAGETALPSTVAPGTSRGMPAPASPLFEYVSIPARTRDSASVPPQDPDPFAETPPIWTDRRYRAAAGGAAVLLLILLIGPWVGDRQAPDPGAAAPPASEPAAPAGSAATGRGTRNASGAAQPAANEPPVTGVIRVELTTSRPVWMRVVVDGERRVERQVPAGQKLTFGADEAIGVRAGDAGAVRLSVNGADRGLLGGDGQVVNRTFRRGS